MSNDTKIKLKSFQALEKRGEIVEIQINDFLISDFNLLISDNAQGKTRLFNSLYFIFVLFSEKPKTIPANFNAKIKFETVDTESIEEILYEINIKPENGKNLYQEFVIRNGKIIFSSKDKTLFNETQGCLIKDYFIPQNVPAIVSVDNTEFITINLIREYFQRIVYVSAEKQNVIRGGDKSIIPSHDGTNIASVLSNWYKSYPAIISEVESELKEFFPFIKRLYLSQETVSHGGIVDVLTFDEEDVGMPIKQFTWSAGVYRILWLIMSTKVPLSDNTKPPSLILIDEIENGLDFKNLKYIINYFQDYSDDSQVVMSSHSPLVCDFVHPRSWIIAKRKGCHINFISPKSVEGDIEDQLELFKHKHWEFYTKHISNSKLYIVK